MDDIEQRGRSPTSPSRTFPPLPSPSNTLAPAADILPACPRRASASALYLRETVNPTHQRTRSASLKDWRAPPSSPLSPRRSPSSPNAASVAVRKPSLSGFSLYALTQDLPSPLSSSVSGSGTPASVQKPLTPMDVARLNHTPIHTPPAATRGGAEYPFPTTGGSPTVAETGLCPTTPGDNPASGQLTPREKRQVVRLNSFSGLDPKAQQNVEESKVAA